MPTFVYLLLSLFFLAVSIGSAMKNRSGNINFFSTNLLITLGFYGTYLWFAKRDIFLTEIATVIGVMCYLTWFVAVILFRDRLNHLVYMLIGMTILIWADGFEYYQLLIGGFSIVILAIRASVWWYFGGRDMTLERMDPLIDLGKKIESSYLTDFFSKRWMPKK